MQSGTVEFIVGRNRKQFWIHNALTSHFPKKILNSPVNDEIDEVDFGRCCEFVYTGDYSIPLPTRESHFIEEDKPAWTPLKRWNPTQLSENIFHWTSIDDYIARWVNKLAAQSGTKMMSQLTLRKTTRRSSWPMLGCTVLLTEQNGPHYASCPCTGSHGCWQISPSLRTVPEIL